METRSFVTCLQRTGFLLAERNFQRQLNFMFAL